MMKKNNNNKRRTGKRARKSGTQHLPLVAAPPASSRVLSTYCTAVSMVESAVSAGATYWFRCNSIYDPDSSGVGGSTLGYSSWLSFYQNYKVRKVTARIQTQVYGMSTGGIGTVIMAPVANQSAVSSNPYAWRAIPFAKMCYATNSNTGSPSVRNMVNTYDLAKVCHVDPLQYDIDMDYAGTAASNPAKQIFLLVALQSTGSSTPASATVSIQLTYEVEWFNPIPLA